MLLKIIVPMQNNSITIQRAICCEKLADIIPNNKGPTNDVALPVSAKKP